MAGPPQINRWSFEAYGNLFGYELPWYGSREEAEAFAKDFRAMYERHLDKHRPLEGQRDSATFKIE